MANTSSLFHLQICPPGESILVRIGVWCQSVSESFQILLFPLQQNLTQLWFTPTPTFNRCLLQTVPILLPLAFLLTLLPFHLCLLFRQHRPQRPTSSIPLNLYNISRFLAVAVVIAVALLRFGYNLYFYMADCSRYSVAGVDLINSLLTMGTYVSFLGSKMVPKFSVNFPFSPVPLWHPPTRPPSSWHPHIRSRMALYCHLPFSRPSPAVHVPAINKPEYSSWILLEPRRMCSLFDSSTRPTGTLHLDLFC